MDFKVDLKFHTTEKAASVARSRQMHATLTKSNDLHNMSDPRSKMTPKDAQLMISYSLTVYCKLVVHQNNWDRGTFAKNTIRDTTTHSMETSEKYHDIPIHSWDYLKISFNGSQLQLHSKCSYGNSCWTIATKSW